jgi:hypothetical protein
MWGDAGVERGFEGPEVEASTGSELITNERTWVDMGRSHFKSTLCWNRNEQEVTLLGGMSKPTTIIV